MLSHPSVRTRAGDIPYNRNTVISPGSNGLILFTARPIADNVAKMKCRNVYKSDGQSSGEVHCVIIEI